MDSPKQKLLFKQALLEAIDEGLLTLGESGKEAIYFHLQNLCALKKEDIPDKLEMFMEGLQKIFGSGAEVIEKATVRSVYLKLGLEFKEKKGYSFLDHLNDAKKASK